MKIEFGQNFSQLLAGILSSLFRRLFPSFFPSFFTRLLPCFCALLLAQFAMPSFSAANL